METPSPYVECVSSANQIEIWSLTYETPSPFVECVSSSWPN